MSGNAICIMAYTALVRLLAPFARVTASVVIVAMRPPPAKRVGKYWPKLMAKPSAAAIKIGANNWGNFTCKNTLQGFAPRLAAT